MNFIEPNIQINGISVEDEIIPVIATSPRLLRKNNFGTFIRSTQKTFGNPSDNLNDAIQEVAERKSKTRDIPSIQNTLLHLLDPDNSEKARKTVIASSTVRSVIDVSDYEDILINSGYGEAKERSDERVVRDNEAKERSNDDRRNEVKERSDERVVRDNEVKERSDNERNERDTSDNVRSNEQTQMKERRNEVKERSDNTRSNDSNLNVMNIAASAITKSFANGSSSLDDPYSKLINGHVDPTVKAVGNAIINAFANEKLGQKGGIPIATPVVPSIVEPKTVIVRRIDYSEQDKINNTDKLIATLDIFKKKYKTLKIPDYSTSTTYDKLLIYIDCAKSQVKQRKKISKYKLMLGGFFLGVELFMHYILNMDPENFTLNQLKNMDQYEIIFNELQDIGIERAIEEWSPLFRILWIMGMHIIIFFGAKMLSKIFGGDTSELQKMISGFLNGKTVEDMDIDDGDEENMVSKVYGIFKAFTSSNRKKDSDVKKANM